MPAYDPTSERVSEDDNRSSPARYLIYLFHVATYEFALQYTSDARVLDMGCGTGYGTHTLAHAARSAVGVDISSEAVAYATERYQAPNLGFRQIAPIERAPLPFDDDSFDVVTSFQVIEHVDDVGAYLSEIGRVLAPAGVFVCATPDRRTRLFPGQRPWNLYHLREYTPDDLEAVLRRHFDGVEVSTMSAPQDVLEAELRRTRRLRLLSYPCTFPAAPEPWRRSGLRLLSRLHAATGRGPQGSGRPVDYGFDQGVIMIAPGAEPSTNIVTVARRPIRS